MGLPNISTGEIIFKSGNFVFLKGQFLMDVSTRGASDYKKTTKLVSPYITRYNIFSQDATKLKAILSFLDHECILIALFSSAFLPVNMKHCIWVGPLLIPTI